MRFNETQFISPGQLDFVPRARRNQIWRTVFAFFVIIAIILFVSLSPTTLGGKNVNALVSIIGVAGLCFYEIYRKQQNLDLVMAAEYQNMLFAQAAALGSSFCLFVRRDGTIVYADRGLRQLFPSFSHGEANALEAVFEQGGVPKPDRERIMGAIYASSSDRLIFPIRNAKGDDQEYVLTVEPLTRPGGFAVIRGREYRGQRAGMQLMPDVLRTTSADKLDHLLASSPLALYATDAFGRFEYVNPALEKLLGYGGGELLEARVAVHHVLSHINGQPVAEDYQLADFHGPLTLRAKHGGVVDATLHQVLMRDDTGKLLGATGTLVPTGKR